MVEEFSNASALDSWFQNDTTGFVDENNCAAGYRLGTWNHNGITEGSLGCAYTTGTNFRIVWTVDNSLIGLIADGYNGLVMYGWWENIAYITN